MDNKKFDGEQLPELEPLMPGEDLHYTRPPDHEEYMDYDMRTKEIFLEADVKKKAARIRFVVRAKEMLVLICIFSIVYVYVMTTGNKAKEWFTIAVIAPVPYGVVMRMVTNKMNFREALRQCKPYLYLSMLHLLSGVFIYFNL